MKVFVTTNNLEDLKAVEEIAKRDQKRGREWKLFWVKSDEDDGLQFPIVVYEGGDQPRRAVGEAGWKLIKKFA